MFSDVLFCYLCISATVAPRTCSLYNIDYNPYPENFTLITKHSTVPLPTKLIISGKCAMYLKLCVERLKQELNS
jgi:hypothetical protein